MTHKIVTLSIQKWGNSLAVRIPASIARSVHFKPGTIVQLDAHDESIIVKATGKQKLTLNERLSSFDPKIHGGEVMQANPIGLEKI